jgi:beta-glucosidase/6-phospho-beta-glucosidase/beta-galactosidase
LPKSLGDDFLWGAAAAQIEGATDEDGKSASL